jgi:phospholipid transport system transporter-binding protein
MRSPLAAEPPRPRDLPAMDETRLVDDGDGKFRVVGEMTFETSPDLLEASEKLFAPHSLICVDLSDVEKADSAGLALMIEWITWANRTVREIRFDHIPDMIMNIARISEIEEMLKVGERWKGFISNDQIP